MDGFPACSRLNSVESRPSADRLESIGKLDPVRLAASPVAAQYSSRFSSTTATATPLACVIFRKRSTITLPATCKSPACDRRNSCVSTIWARASVGSGLVRGSTSKVFCSCSTCAASRSCWNVASSSAGFSRSLMMVSSSWSRVPGLSGSAIGQCNSPSTVLGATSQPLDSSSLDGLEPYPNRCTQVLALLGIMASRQLPFVGPSSQPHLHTAPREIAQHRRSARHANYCTFPVLVSSLVRFWTPHLASEHLLAHIPHAAASNQRLSGQGREAQLLYEVRW